MGVTLTTENVLEALRAAERDAASAYAALEKTKADIVASGVNPLTDADAFAKLDEAGKAYDLKAQEAEELKDKLVQLQRLDGAAAPRGGLPLPASGGQRTDTLFRIGQRLTDHPSYQKAKELADRLGDAQFAAAMERNIFGDGIQVMSRAEVHAMLRGRFAATAVTGGSSTSAGPFIQNDLQPGYIDYRRKTPRLAAIVGQAETDSDVVEYVEQSAPTNNAAETAETNNAAESAYPFATRTTNVQEIVHYVPITRRAMQDAGQMRSIVEGELVADVVDRLDTQIASGGGTGDNLEGIYTAVTQSQDAAGLGKAEAIHKGITKIRVAAGVFMEPDYIGIHPNDYEQLVLEQDGNGRFLTGDPALPGPRTLWGVPFVVSTAFTENTPLVGNYERGARLWIRSGIEVLSGLNDDDFVKRRISLMATMRAAFKTVRPTAFCEITNF